MTCQWREKTRFFGIIVILIIIKLKISKISKMLYQSSPSFSLAGTSITRGLSIIRAVLWRWNYGIKIKSFPLLKLPASFLHNSNNPSLVALDFLDVLTVGSSLLSGKGKLPWFFNGKEYYILQLQTPNPKTLLWWTTLR